MTTKLNSLRILEARKIPHVATTYDPAGGFHSAEQAAELLRVPPEVVYKTLVVLREPPGKGKPVLVMVPANQELDLKALARSLGEKKLRMATQREAEALTGLQVGGISALALLNRGFQICIHQGACALERMHVSAGRRGVDVQLRPTDLIAVTGAQVVEAIGRDPQSAESG